MNVVSDMPFKLPMNTSYHMLKDGEIHWPPYGGVGPHACFASVRVEMQIDNTPDLPYNNNRVDSIKYYAWTGSFKEFDLAYWTDKWLEVTLRIPFIKERVIEYTGYDHGTYCPITDEKNKPLVDKYPLINEDKYFLIDYTVPIDEPFVVSSVLRIPQEFPHHIVTFKEVLEDTGDELLAWICSLYYGYENKERPSRGSHNPCNNLDPTFWQEFYRDPSIAGSKANAWQSNVLGGMDTAHDMGMNSLIACILNYDPPVHHVAVYGSLRKGMGNHPVIGRHLETGSAIQQATTVASLPAQMYDTGAGFPALVIGNKSNVVVEKYKVSDEAFKDIDRLEGYPHLYDRTQVIIQGDPCWIYFQKTASENYVRCGHDWVSYCMRKHRRVYAQSW